MQSLIACRTPHGGVHDALTHESSRCPSASATSGNLEDGDWEVWFDGVREFGLATNDTAHGRRLLDIRDRLVTSIIADSPRRVLDLGAGEGLLSLALAEETSADVVAVDPSLRALTRLSAGSRRVRTVSGDALNLPFAMNVFDHVVWRSVLIFLEDGWLALKEVARVLSRSGRCVMFEPLSRYGQVTFNCSAALARQHAAVSNYQVQHWRGFDRMIHLTEDVVYKWITEAGFVEVDIVVERASSIREGLPDGEVQEFLFAQPHPGALTYAHCSRLLLGSEAESHLSEMGRVLVSEEIVSHKGGLFAWARKG
jgi:ubiquinone/menaquinone biosynthesis C-methylase UbiE